MSKIFRKASLDRLSSPDQLDQLVSITTPIGWMLTTAVSIILISTLAWSIFGKIPTMVQGEGILLPPSGISTVVATVDGQVVLLPYKQKDAVEADDVVVQIRNSHQPHDLTTAQNQFTSGRTRITSHYAGIRSIISELRVTSGQFVEKGDTLAILIGQEQRQATQRLVLYFPTEVGQKIKPGMKVHFSSHDALFQEKGLSETFVSEVSSYPVSKENMMTILKHQGLVDHYYKSGPPIAVYADLVFENLETRQIMPKPESTFNIVEGRLCTARVEIDSFSPLSLLFPHLKSAVSE